MIDIINTFATMLSIPLVAYVLLYVHQQYQLLNEDSGDTTWEYCTIMIDSDIPSKYHGRDYIPPQHHIVLEENESGAYRYRSLDTVLDEAQDDEDDQVVSE